MRRDLLWARASACLGHSGARGIHRGRPGAARGNPGRTLRRAKRASTPISAPTSQLRPARRHFGPAADDEDANVAFKGWVRCAWSRPTGEALEEVTRRLKTLRLTIRNAPMVQPETFAPCLFTGEPGVEEILVARPIDAGGSAQRPGEHHAGADGGVVAPAA